MTYPAFWTSLCDAHRAAEPLSCPSCRKGVPMTLRQCPECAQVFQGKGWGGIEAHWTSHHDAVMSYPEFWASLCPGHRGDGDPRAGYLPLPLPGRRGRRR
jgi:predicted amidophosphoribosyltransferase